MAMLSPATAGLRPGLCSSVVRAYVIVDGSSWHRPSAPVGDRAFACHPDSHQHSASRRLAGSPDARRGQEGGAQGHALGMLLQAQGKGPAPAPHPAGGRGGGGKRRWAPAKLLKEVGVGDVVRGHERRHRCLVPGREEIRVSPGRTTTVVVEVGALGPTAGAAADGICKVVPATMRLAFVMPLAAMSAATVVSYRAAMALRVSPGWMVMVVEP